MSNSEVVRVGSKPQSAYVSAVLFCLNQWGQAKIQGLGKRQGKVLAIAERVSEIDSVEIHAINSLYLEKTTGLEVIVKTAGGR